MSELHSDALAEFNEAFAPTAPAEDVAASAEPPTDTPAPEAATVDETDSKPDKPRDEQGRFAKQEDDRPLAGKYKTVEDLEKAYLEAQSALGSFKNEIGELRSMVDELPNRMQPATAYDTDTIEANPGAVAQSLALEAFQREQHPEGHPVYEAALREWFDQDPYEASKFHTQVERVWATREIQQRTQPLQQNVQQQIHDARVAEFGRQHPDIQDHQEAILEIANEHPVLSNLLKSENIDDKIGALDALYQLAKARSPQQSAPVDPATLTDHERKASEQAAQAVADAAVVTGGNTNVGEPPVMDEADRMWEAWQTLGVSHLR